MGADHWITREVQRDIYLLLQLESPGIELPSDIAGCKSLKDTAKCFCFSHISTLIFSMSLLIWRQTFSRWQRRWQLPVPCPYSLNVKKQSKTTTEERIIVPCWLYRALQRGLWLALGHKATLEPITEPGKKEDSNWPARIMYLVPRWGYSHHGWLLLLLLLFKKKKTFRAWSWYLTNLSDLGETMDSKAFWNYRFCSAYPEKGEGIRKSKEIRQWKCM